MKQNTVERAEFYKLFRLLLDLGSGAFLDLHGEKESGIICSNLRSID